jgi:decaprenyl-phosphate phosphoribosyltransferase
MNNLRSNNELSTKPERSESHWDNVKDYISIARPDHWFKNIFMLPGMFFALIYFPVELNLPLVFTIITGVFSTCLIASANYVINEWLDAEFDKFHPVKKHRRSVTKQLKGKIVYLEYFTLAVIGLGLAYSINRYFFYAELLLLIMGLLYNIKPFRSKDKVYLDVLSESINNPIRFCLGWFIIAPTIFPPSSILMAYWMAGAFLMATKRFGELRFIDNPQLAGLYRKSFIKYTERRLLISIFFYAMTSCFFLGIYLIKHKIELLLSFPFIALLFSWYLNIAFEKDSVTQRPEKLYTRKYFMTYIILLCLGILFLMFVNLDFLNYFLINNF